MAEKSPLFTNKLIGEKSPYLLQHAHDQINWYPWGTEAFLAAKDQDKPIFLSIGYFSCHWCHVMDSESFDNPEVARLMNETFICIKVDREEKPEIDSLYMEFAQAMMSGGAGWPLNVLLTPDLMPFFAVTYLPATAKSGFLGLKQLIERIGEIWKDIEEREAVIMQAGRIVNLFETQIHTEGSILPQKELIAECAELLFKTADPIHGGMRGAPKFPMGCQACFLLRFSKKTSDSRALFYVEQTLQMMRRGGIWDHLGGGFSRYSVDERWCVPHFEKMLYDNAILARAYLETWAFTHLSFYRTVAMDILNYLSQQMRAATGGFFSAEDADVHEQEGQYYLWSWQQIHDLLKQDAAIFCEFYGITPTGNFEGKNILHEPFTFQEFALHHRIDPILLETTLQQCKDILREVRKSRAAPQKDSKIVTAWNGLAIYIFAESSLAMHHAPYLKIALDAAIFIRDHLWTEEKLLRRYCEGEAKFVACLDDYAFLISGLISLFEADAGVEWLQWAIELAEVLQTQFKVMHGAYYLTDGSDPDLLLRRCEFYDGAEPSGNAVHTENLLRLYALTGKSEYLNSAEDVLKAAKQHLELYPPAGCYHLMCLMRYLENPVTLIVALNDQENFRDEIRQMFSARFIINRALIWRRETDEELLELSDIARDKKCVEGKTTLYICRNAVCEPPITDIALMWQALEKL